MSKESIERTAAAWLVRRADGDLTPAEQKAFSRWLDDNPAHEAALRRMQHVWDACGSPTPAGAQIAAPKRPRWATGLAVAASILIALLLIPRGTDPVPTEALEYRAGTALRDLHLEDGSRVLLDADSLLKVKYTEHERGLVLVYGQARFFVAQSVNRPFRVRAGAVEAGALGTVFDVSHRDGETAVLIVEGRVALSNATAGISEQAQVARAGDHFVWRGEAAAQVQSAADINRLSSWVDGRIVFNGEPLHEAVARINRHTDRPIEVPDSLADDTPIYGVFRTGDTAAFLRALAAEAPQPQP